MLVHLAPLIAGMCSGSSGGAGARKPLEGCWKVAGRLLEGPWTAGRMERISVLHWWFLVRILARI